VKGLSGIVTLGAIKGLGLFGLLVYFYPLEVLCVIGLLILITFAGWWEWFTGPDRTSWLVGLWDDYERYCDDCSYTTYDYNLKVCPECRGGLS